MSLHNELRRFASRSPRERWLFAEAFFLLGIFRLLIITLPFQRIVRLLRFREGEGGSSPTVASPFFLNEVSWAIQAAASRTPWESVCLGQALTGAAMLKRRGLSGTFYLGVSRDPAVPGAISAHAWLRSGNLTLTGVNGCERYAVISAYSW